MAMLDRNKVLRDFRAAVNMTAAELEDWLDTEESRKVGWTRPACTESVGLLSGRRIVAILQTPEPALDEGDYRHMRRVVGFIRRIRALEPANAVTSRWRWSLMNWGCDPLKD
jgi:hypothetical protein